MIKIVYSYNKKGYEAKMWAREIAGASNLDFRFVPFNHDPYLNPQSYIRAQLLDNLYYERDQRLQRLYADFERVVEGERADALIVDTCPPYHPEFLLGLQLYKVLRIADGPMASYDRDFAYLHAYDHVLYHSPAYSRDMGMNEKLRYCKAPMASFWPLALFDGGYDPEISESELFSKKRDLDIVFVGALHPNKMPILAAVKKEFGRRFVMHGLSSVKRNLYFNVKYRVPSWVTPIDPAAYVPLYQRAKLGINAHNRGKYTVGGYRLFELPANGVMQVSDGGEHLSAFFEPEREIVGYEDVDELLAKIDYFLTHENERVEMARAGYRRVLRDHRIVPRLHEAGTLIEEGIRSRQLSPTAVTSTAG